MTRSNPLRSHPALSGIGLVAAALAVAFGVCEWRGWPFLRQPLQDFLADRIDRRVEIGPAFELKTLGAIRVRTDTMSIGPPRWAPQGAQDRFFDARDVLLELPWSTIWSLAVTREAEPIRVRTLEVGSFDAALWRRVDGKASWDFARTATRPEGGRLPEFDRFVVRSGTLKLDDAPLDLHLAASAATAEGQADGGLLIKGSGRYRAGEFGFTVRSDGVLPLISPAGSEAKLPLTAQAQTRNGRVRFDGVATDVLHFNKLEGRFVLSGNSLARVGQPFGVTLPTTAPFEAEGRIGKDGKVWRADFARFEVGASQLAGEFTFDRRPQPPLLSGVLRGRNLDLADLGPAFGAKGPENTGTGSRRPGKVLPDRVFDIPSLKTMDADVRIDLQRADLHTPVLEPLAPLRSHLTLQDGVLKAEQIAARTSGGEVTGRLALDGRVVQQPKWEGDLRWAGVQLERWIKVRNERDKDPGSHKGDTHYVSGALGGHATFTGHGRSIAAMAASLDGSIAAWVRDGQLSHLLVEAAGIDIAQALGVLVRGDKPLSMTCAVTRFTARDGALHADVGVIDTTDTTLLIGGDISLDDERIALVAHAYPKDFSPLTLRTPVHVLGPFEKPKVRLDPKPAGIKAVAAVALATVHPLAGLIPLMDPGEKAPSGCTEAAERMRKGGKVPPAVETDTPPRRMAPEPVGVRGTVQP